jgi:hypothetical protein
MARPIKVLCASEDVKIELRRRANGRSSEHRKRFRAEIILLRLQGGQDRGCGDTAEHFAADGLDLVVAFRSSSNGCAS